MLDHSIAWNGKKGWTRGKGKGKGQAVIFLRISNFFNMKLEQENRGATRLAEGNGEIVMAITKGC